MTPECSCRVRHTKVSLTVYSHYHHGCRASLLTTSCVRHNFPCVATKTGYLYPFLIRVRCMCIARNTKTGGRQRRQRPSRQIVSWSSRCGGEEIRLIMRDKELFVNREHVRASFCKTAEVCFVCVRSRFDGYW